MVRWFKKSPGAIALAVLVLVLVSGSAYAFWRSRGIQQPIAFNHKLHVEGVQIECSNCHQYYESGEHSGLPTLDVCMGCHSEPVTESAEEAKIRDLSQQGRSAVFRKLFQLPSHVYYSHRRHVMSAKLECAQCHGQIASTETPPLRPMVQVTMDFCVNCHHGAKARNDCNGCHR